MLLIPLHVPVTQMMLHYGGRGIHWIVLLTSAAAGAAGAILVSAREPGVQQTISDKVLRWLLRVTCLAWLALVTLLYLGARWQWFRSIQFPFNPLAFELLCYLFNAVTLYAAFAQLDNVAVRIDRRELARWFVIFRFLAPLFAAAPVLLRMPWLPDAPPQAVVILRLFQHILLIASLFVLGRLYDALRSVTPPALR